MDGFAKVLDDMIFAIVDGGYMDDLGDDSIRAMAERIAANECEIINPEEFKITFCDKSEIIFHRCD
jgi:hypothetical protein